jgi:hypothetical protein
MSATNRGAKRWPNAAEYGLRKPVARDKPENQGVTYAFTYLSHIYGYDWQDTMLFCDDSGSRVSANLFQPARWRFMTELARNPFRAYEQG